MNLPDVTLIFQMLHFLVAYTILRRFVFAPALALIEQNEEYKDQLLKNVDTTMAEQKELVGQQRQSWKMIQHALISMIPRFNAKNDVDVVRISTPIELSDVKLSEQQKQNIQKMLHDELSDVEL